MPARRPSGPREAGATAVHHRAATCIASNSSLRGADRESILGADQRLLGQARRNLHDRRVAESELAELRAWARRSFGSRCSGRPTARHQATRYSARPCPDWTLRPRTAGAASRCGASLRWSDREADGVASHPDALLRGSRPRPRTWLSRPQEADRRGVHRQFAAPSGAALGVSALSVRPEVRPLLSWRTPRRQTDASCARFFTSLLIDDELADEGTRQRAGRPLDLQRLEQDSSTAAAFSCWHSVRGSSCSVSTSARNAELSSKALPTPTAAPLPTTRSHSIQRGPATFVDIAVMGRLPPCGPFARRRRPHPQHGRGQSPHWQEFGAGGGELAECHDCSSPRPRSSNHPGTGAVPVSRRGGRRLASISASGRAGWLGVIHGRGFEAVQSAYLDVLDGRVDAKGADAPAPAGNPEAAWPAGAPGRSADARTPGAALQSADQPAARVELLSAQSVAGAEVGKA